MNTLAQELDVIDLQRRQKRRAAQNVEDALEALYRLREIPSDLDARLALAGAKVTWEYVARHEGIIKTLREMDPADIGLIPVRPTQPMAAE